MQSDPCMGSRFRERKYKAAVRNDVAALANTLMTPMASSLLCLVPVPMHRIVRMRRHLLRGLRMELRKHDTEVR
jgi:hypothetical protein